MATQNPVVTLREVERGLDLFAAEVEDRLKTRPTNVLYWRNELREAIATLENGGWAPATGRSSDASQVGTDAA